MKAASVATKKQAMSTYALVLIPLMLVALTIFFYYPSLKYNFLFDDIGNISKNFSIRHNTFSTLFFSSTRWISAWLNTLCYKIDGFNPFTYRCLSITIHSLTGLLVYFLTFNALSHRKRDDMWARNALPISVLNGALFLLHPVQTQTVSYVIQSQLEGLSTLLTLSIISLITYVKLCKVPHKIAVPLCAFLAFIATGTKEIAIVTPFLALIFDWFFIAQGDSQDFKKRIYIHATLGIVILGSYLILLKPKFFSELFGLKMTVYNNFGNMLTQTYSQKIEPLPFFISQFKVVLHYLAIFIYPFNISVEYDWKLSSSFFALDCFLPLLVLLGLAYAALKEFTKDSCSVVTFAFLWCFIFLAPRCSLIPSGELLVDYKTYGASFAILLLIAGGIIATLQKVMRDNTTNLGAAIGLIALTCGTLTLMRNKVWQSPQAFWSDITQKAPLKARAHNNYAIALYKNGDIDAAAKHYEQAIALDSHYPDPYHNLAVLYSRKGNLDQAIATLEKSLSMNSHNPEGYNSLGAFYMTKKDYQKSRLNLEKALKLRPTYGLAALNLGYLLYHQGDYEQSYLYLKRACTQADQDNANGFKAYGQICMKLKKYQEAIQAYTNLVNTEPQAPNNYLFLAQAYLEYNQPQLALKLAQKIAQKDPNNINALLLMAESNYALKNYHEAGSLFDKVLTHGHTSAEAAFAMADCLCKTGQAKRGCTLLRSILQTPETPANIKDRAQKLLNETMSAM